MKIDPNSPTCPHCGRTQSKNGFYNGTQMYRCRNCAVKRVTKPTTGRVHVPRANGKPQPEPIISDWRERTRWIAEYCAKYDQEHAEPRPIKERRTTR